MNVSKFSYLVLVAGILISSCGDDKNTGDTGDNKPPENVENVAPAVINYQIVKEYPHDHTAFTEGLQFVDGFLYESTGRYGKSDIRKTEVESGRIVQQTKMNDKFFGEGITILNGKIYQLTYMEHTGFIYDLATMKQTGTFTFPNKEGWGMTTDGTNLIYNDGGHVLYFLDPNTMQQVKAVEVIDEHGPVKGINELEYIKGFIYANQWQTDYIFKIDPATGKVVGRANLFDLRQKTGIPYPLMNDENAPEVMNGIAYDAASNRIFVTGKNWPKLIEIKLDN